MLTQEFEENLKILSELLAQLPKQNEEAIHPLIYRYIEQNLIVLNDVFSISIDNLKRLQQAENANDIICTQAKFATEMTQKLNFSAQRFLNASLTHLSDYNEWLKTNCDLATD